MVFRSDALVVHAVQLLYGLGQVVLVQGEAGTLPGTVLYVVGFVQHHNLASEVDFQLRNRQRNRNIIAMFLTSLCNIICFVSSIHFNYIKRFTVILYILYFSLCKKVPCKHFEKINSCFAGGYLLLDRNDGYIG